MTALKRLAIALAALVVILTGVTVVTGTSLLPVAFGLGPCLRDWTSAVAYRHRQSPLAELRFSAGDADLLLCYGRPSSRGRIVFGQLVPYGELWRLGANEPTRLATSQPVSLAGISLPAGRYSIYVRPGPDAWDIVVSHSTMHWGNDTSETVRRQEVGRATVAVEVLPLPVETLTVRPRADPAGGRTDLIIDWERTRVTLPVVRTAPSHAVLPEGSRP